jgi:hypothetical protein
MKDFAFELAPVIQDIYNQSLKDGNIPLPLKSSIVNPIPRGAGAAGATAPLAQTVRGQHGGNRLPFLPELHFEIRALFTGIGIYNYF